MSIEDNKALVQGFIKDVMNTGNVDAIADYCVARSMFAGGLAGQIQAMRAPFPDMKFTIEEIVAEGDKVVVRGTSRGTHSGPLIGLPAFGRLETPMSPSGKSITVTEISIFTVSDGKITSYTHELDQISLLHQLGWTFTPPDPA